MSAELSRQEAAGRTTGRTLDLAAAGLALAQVAAEAIAEGAFEVSNAQADAVQKASEQVVAALGGLRGMHPCQRNVAAEIADELSTLAADLPDEPSAGLTPA